jgi:hypothetical protein
LSLRAFIVESTWGYPIIGAIHVLGIAWFGGTILVSTFIPEVAKLRRAGIVLLLISGAVLFWLQPAQYYTSISFWVKIVLIVAGVSLRPGNKAYAALWIAIVFASRGIAYF